MKVINRPYANYIDDLEAGKFFTFSRFNDGEWNSIVGRLGHNCDYCDYDIARIGLSTALSHQYDYYYTTSAATYYEDTMRDEWLANNGITIKWHDSDIFHEASERDELKPLTDIIKQMKVLCVGNTYMRRLQSALNFTRLIQAPARDATRAIGRITAEVRKRYKEEKPDLIFFAAGFATNMVIDRLHPEIGSECFMIDFGSVFDPYQGRLTRTYMIEQQTKGRQWIIA